MSKISSRGLFSQFFMGVHPWIIEPTIQHLTCISLNSVCFVEVGCIRTCLVIILVYHVVYREVLNPDDLDNFSCFYPFRTATLITSENFHDAERYPVIRTPTRPTTEPRTTRATTAVATTTRTTATQTTTTQPPVRNPYTRHLLRIYLTSSTQDCRRDVVQRVVRLVSTRSKDSTSYNAKCVKSESFNFLKFLQTFWTPIYFY